MQWAGEAMTDPTEALAESANLSVSMPDLDGLLPALQRLDRLLEQAVAAAQATYDSEAATDHYRGFYISQADVERLLAREPGVPTLWTDGTGAEEPSPDIAGDATRLAWLARAFGLSRFDVDLILITLAPELDLRYEPMVLAAYILDNYISILQTKFSDREGHEARRVGSAYRSAGWSGARNRAIDTSGVSRRSHGRGCTCAGAG
jgi:hypothetical protein